MVEKLIKSNPTMYTLPMIREGVSQFILKLSTTESFEKTIGIKAVVATTGAAALQDKTELLFQAEALIQAKSALLTKNSSVADVD